MSSRSTTSDPPAIERVDVGDDDGMATTDAIFRAAHLARDPHDPLPTTAEILAQARSGDLSMTREFFLLRVHGRPVATTWLDYPLLDNPDLIEVDVAVEPSQQGSGLGRHALAMALERAAELGRHQVIAAASEAPDGGPDHVARFLAAAGFTRALGEMRRTLHLHHLDLDRLSSLRADADQHAVGYRLVSWTGPCPDELVEQYASLVARMSTDAPMGGLDVEPEQWDRVRVREQERLLLAQGRTAVTTAARLGDDGPLVAFTELVTTVHDTENVFQWNTLVLREHRGRRLGMLVKLANLDRLLAHAPDALSVHTWNATENEPMIAVNEAMGFVATQRECAWRLDLPR